MECLELYFSNPHKEGGLTKRLQESKGKEEPSRMEGSDEKEDELRLEVKKHLESFTSSLTS